MAESKLTSVLPNNTIKGSVVGKGLSTVYQENDNVMKNLENIMYVNDVELGFQNDNFSGNNIFRFSRNYQFLGPVIMRIDVTYPNVDDCGAYEDYIIYNLIRRIRWTAGGTELLSINRENLVNMVLDQCESHMKKVKILKYAGTASPVSTTATIRNQTVTYECIIPFPWSSACAKTHKSMPPFPLYALSEPLECQIELATVGDVFRNNNVTLSNGQLLFSYGKVGSPEELKKSIYRYNFTSVFSHVFNATDKGTDETVSVDLNGFRKGECRQIQIHAISQRQFEDKQFQSGRELKDLQLLFNGQVIWQSNKTTALWDLAYNTEPSVHGYRELINNKETGNVWTAGHKNVAQGAAGEILADNTQVTVYGFCGDVKLDDSETLGQQEKYYYNIPLAEILDKYLKHNYAIAPDFTKQSIQLRFKGQGLTAKQTLKVYVAYYYSAMYQFDGEAALLVF